MAPASGKGRPLIMPPRQPRMGYWWLLSLLVGVLMLFGAARFSSSISQREQCATACIVEAGPDRCNAVHWCRAKCRDLDNSGRGR